MNVLFISTNYELFSDMEKNMWYSLAEEMNLTFFGPGFTDDKTLEEGIIPYLEKNDGFDLIVCTFGLLHLSATDFSARELYFYNRMNISHYKLAEAIRFATWLSRDLIHISIPKVLMIVDDMASFSTSMSDYIEKYVEEGFYLFMCGKEFTSKMPMTGVYADNMITSCYRNLVENNSEKIVSLPVTAASVVEFFSSSLIDREYDWCVPGNLSKDYHTRYSIHSIIKKNNYSVYDDFKNRNMGYEKGMKYKSAYSIPFRRLGDIASWREEYNQALRNTRVAYADGGVSRVIVRKYFEIPARGCVLMCDDIGGLKELGFIDDLNMIIVSPENVVEKSRELFSDYDKMQKIADAGQKLVMHKHTFRKRAIDAKMCFERIIEGTFRGSCWKDGDFILL